MQIKALAQRFLGYLKPYRVYAPWLALGLLANLFLIVINSRARTYNSDDVGGQVMLHTIQTLGVHAATVWVGPDTFVLKLPFYWLMSLLNLSPRAELLVTNLVFVLFSYAVFGWLLAWFARRYGVRPWLYGSIYFYTCVSTTAAWSYLASPNFRDPEFGFVFLLIAWMVLLHSNRRVRWWLQGLLALVVAVFAGLLMYSDPYFEYLFVVPTLLYFGWRLLSARLTRADLLIVVTLALSLKLRSVWEQLVVHLLHYSSVGASAIPTVIPLSQLNQGVLNAISASVTLFNANIFGGQFSGSSGARVALNAAILVGMLVVGWLGVRKSQTVESVNWPQYFFLLVVFTPFVYILAALPGGVNYRYFLTWCFFLPFGFLYGVRRANWRQSVALGGVILVAGLLNLHAISLVNRIGAVGPNADALAINQAVEQQGLTKGYAPYWVAVINDYFSGGKINYIQTICYSGLQTYNWWLDDKVTTVPAQRSFIILDEDDSLPHCTEPQIQQQFGSPAGQEVIENRYILLRYNYDVTSKMGVPYTP